MVSNKEINQIKYLDVDVVIEQEQMNPIGEPF